MTFTDFIATLALVIAAGTFALQVKQWFDSGPRIHLSVMGDAVQFPDDDDRPKLALTVTNRGNEPTQITHVIVFKYHSWLNKWRRKPYFTAIVNSPGIPMLLEARRYWIGIIYYDEALSSARAAGEVYVGIYATHNNREFLIKVPPKKDEPQKSGTIGGSEG